MSFGKFAGKNDFVWFKGVVEDRQDPLKIGRAKVRIFGWHTQDKLEMPTENLPWALPIVTLDDGQNVVGLKEGDWVIGFFFDGDDAQQPVITGKIPGVPEEAAIPEFGFYDPTPDESLNSSTVPRPPEMAPINDINKAIEDAENPPEPTVILPKYKNPDKLPGVGTAFGVLESDFDPNNYPYDQDGDGKWTEKDAQIIADPDGDGQYGVGDLYVGEYSFIGAQYPISRYPLEDRLKEPSSSRLARNEQIDKTIVGRKRGVSGFDAGSTDYLDKEQEDTRPEGDEASEGSESRKSLMAGFETVAVESFEEPETPYDARYPYNHVYESESGHVIEIDDTPGVERLHRYHRSGTFEEIHPDGIKVDKTVKDHYNMVIENYYTHSGGNTIQTADKNFKMKSGAMTVMQVGSSLHIDVGDSAFVKITEDANIIIGGNVKMLVEEDVHVHVKGDVETYIEGDERKYIEGDLHTYVEGNEYREIEGNRRLAVGASLHESSMTYLNEAGLAEHLGQVSIPNGQVEVAAFSNIASYAVPATVQGKSPIFVPSVEVPNDIDKAEEIEEVEEPESAGIQAGFILDTPKNGDLWKPVSESDGNLCTLSEGSGQHKIFEAIPTGELEEYTIRYMSEDLTITEWTVMRPIHKKGRLIEEGRSTGSLGGREVWRFSKPGKDYPKQCLLETGFTRTLPKEDSRSQGWLILDSGIRHD
jgi:hypothetical protein